MSDSSSVFSLSIGTAVSGGGDPDSNHLPQPDGAAYVGMAVGTGAIDLVNFQEASHSEDQGRRTVGDSELISVGLVNNSGGEKFNTPVGQTFRAGYPDSVSVQHRIRGLNGADPGGFGFGKILGSSMGQHSPAVATITTQAASGEKSELIIDSNDIATIPVGAPFRVREAGQIVDEYAIVTASEDQFDGTHKITCHPELTFTPQDNQEIQLCYAFYPVIGSANTAKQDFFARMDIGAEGTQAEIRTVLAGCRATGFTINNGDGVASLEMSFRPLVALQDDANANVVAAEEAPGKAWIHRYGCRVDVSSNIAGGVAPFKEGRSYLPNLDHTISVEFETAPGTPETRGIMTGSTHEIHNSKCTVSINSEKNAILQQMIVKNEIRTLICGFGPSGNMGEGGAFILKNAGRDSGDAALSAGDGNRVEQQTTLRAIADFKGCDTAGLDAAGLRLATAPFLLVFPKA